MPIASDRLPQVAVIGRPNVGKSSLFNRITGRRHSIVEDTPGVTRDSIEARVDWDRRPFVLIDTGGVQRDPTEVDPVLDREQRKIILDAVRDQVFRTLKESDLVVMVVDGKSGLTPDDEDVADLARRACKPVLLVVNKVDNARLEDRVYEFYSLGFGEPIGVSAEHGRNVGELLDRILSHLPETPEDDQAPDASEEDITKVCVLGRPNAGKSSLVNRLFGDQRLLVSDIPGTTRDSVDVIWEAGDSRFLLIDTAGMRRKAKINHPIEYYSNLRTIRSIERSDVALIVLDATREFSEQDKKIAGLAHERGTASIILVNKWDAVQNITTKEFETEVRNQMPFMAYAPFLFISAKTGLGLHKLPGLIEKVAANRVFRAKTPDVNRVIHDAQALHAPPGRKGRHLKIYYATQASVEPPTFVLFVNDPELMHYSYERYLENRLREAFDFTGTPIRFEYRIRHRQPPPGREPR